MPDVVTLGESMLRLSVPAGQTLEESPAFHVHVAGAESNMAVTLARLGTSAGWISRLPATPLGRRVATWIRGHGVDVSRVLWAPEGRIGAYFVEPAPAPRAYRVIYDRAHSAFAEIDPAEVDWAFVRSARLLHLTGITPALGRRSRDLVERALREAREERVPVSFDINYRARLWPPQEARQTLAPLLQEVAILLCTLEDARMLLEGEPDAAGAALALAERFRVRTAVVTDGGLCAAVADGRPLAQEGFAVEAVDRIGAGDAFAAGVLQGWLAGSMERGLACGMAAAALKHTFHGDVAMITPRDVEDLIAGRSRWR